MQITPQLPQLELADARLLFEEQVRHTRQLVADELQKLAGAHRSYTWAFYDPALLAQQGLPLAPASYPVDLVCRPIDFVITCADGYPPSGTLSCSLRYSQDKGQTWRPLTGAPTTIPGGQYYGAGATFPVTAAEQAAGILYRVLHPGDMITLEPVPTFAGAKGIVLHVRTQRVREHALIGRT